jgi:hypothetical protein
MAKDLAWAMLGKYQKNWYEPYIKKEYMEEKKATT